MKQSLLIADGDAELCELYRGFLTDRGYEVETASDGLDCLWKLRQRTPAALVLDLELCWGGGDGVLAWLREESPCHGVPVILTATAGCAPDVAATLNTPPVVSVLPKPFALAALLEKVGSAVANNGQGSSNQRRYSELFIG